MDNAWLQLVKAKPMRHTEGPRAATSANDFLIFPMDVISFLTSPSASQADGMEKHISNKYGRADKNPFWKQ